MSNDAMSLKAKIRNLSKEKGIKAQVLLQNYMFERFLERLSLSKYVDNFVLKGGALIAAIVGIDARSTMDVDATIRGLQFSERNILGMLDEICSLPVPDGVKLTVGTLQRIRLDDIYGGYRARITAIYETIETPFLVDVSTGDVITPHPVKHTLQGILDENKQIELWAYNIETVIAEKVETILRRSTLNTRARDFYDVFILGSTQAYSADIVKQAVAATAAHRGTTNQITDVTGLLKVIEGSGNLRQMWEKYRRDFSYAEHITYEQVMESLRDICQALL